MGKFSLCKACLLFCVVVLKHSDAEPLYFLQDNSVTWDEARSECQRCFQDLVTVIPNTTNVIVASQTLTSDYWIGLRKNMSPSSSFTSNSSSGAGLPWSRWANGGPLAFQNWYPGWPKVKPNPPNISCCSCACTCPAAPDPVPTSVTHYDVTAEDILNGSYSNSTPNLNYPARSSPFASVSPAMPVASQCERTPMAPVLPVLPEDPDPDQDYIEDSCVAMLSNGAWVEKNCSDLLPFICYEDRFYGGATVSNVTASTAIIAWLPGPNGTSRHRLEVTYTNTTTYKVLQQDIAPPFAYTYRLEHLSPGSRYDVAVFAIKCQRDVYDPQRVSFYTIPNKVVNLTFTARTPTSISLSWTKPDDGVDLYRLQYNNETEFVRPNSMLVSGLTPGTQYTFTVWSGVNDTSKWSEPTSISLYTVPDKVSNLGVAARNSSSLTVNWTGPSGAFAGFNVLAVNMFNNTVFWSQNQSQTSSNITGLPSGTQVNVTVTVVGFDGQQGVPVQMFTYTAPESVFNLNMIPTSNSFNVTWNYSAPVYSPFLLLLQSSADKDHSSNTINLWFNFSSLKTATYYTVTVWSVVENTQSSPKICSKFTLPMQPVTATLQSSSTNQLTFQWTPPANIGTSSYSVKLSSPFWGQSWNDTTNQTSYMFTNLTSGSSYAFEVRTLAGDLKSEPTTASAMTVSELVDISLAMQCSSATALLCSNDTTKKEIFEKLNTTIYNLLGHNVSWGLGYETFPDPAP